MRAITRFPSANDLWAAGHYFNGICSGRRRGHLPERAGAVPVGRCATGLLRGLIAFAELPMSDAYRLAAEPAANSGQGLTRSPMLQWMLPEVLRRTARGTGDQMMFADGGNDTWFRRTHRPLLAPSPRCAQMRTLEEEAVVG